MAAYALFLSICDLTHLFFINSFLFYLISIYRVIYHCSPRSARSSRLRIRAHLQRTGRAMAARIAKDLRAYPEVFFCFRWLSALHLLAEKAGDRMERLLEKELGGERHTNRLSPGYCGWHLTGQKTLFRLMGGSPCGISLSDVCLMTPIKSISGIIGIGPEVDEKKYGCQYCELETCYKRKRKKK